MNEVARINEDAAVDSVFANNHITALCLLLFTAVIEVVLGKATDVLVAVQRVVHDVIALILTSGLANQRQGSGNNAHVSGVCSKQQQQQQK